MDKKNLKNDGVSHILRTASVIEEVTDSDIRKVYKQAGKRQIMCDIQTILPIYGGVVWSLQILEREWRRDPWQIIMIKNHFGIPYTTI